jgi:hypothetical protein
MWGLTFYVMFGEVSHTVYFKKKPSRNEAIKLCKDQSFEMFRGLDTTQWNLDKLIISQWKENEETPNDENLVLFEITTLDS